MLGEERVQRRRLRGAGHQQGGSRCVSGNRNAMVADCQLPSSPIHAHALVNASTSVRVQADRRDGSTASSPERLSRQQGLDALDGLPDPGGAQRSAGEHVDQEQRGHLLADVTGARCGGEVGEQRVAQDRQGRLLGRGDRLGVGVDEVLPLGDPAAQHRLPVRPGPAVHPVRVHHAARRRRARTGPATASTAASCDPPGRVQRRLVRAGEHGDRVAPLGRGERSRWPRAGSSSRR